MKNKLKNMLLAILLATGFQKGAAQINLVPNPSFEQMQNGCPPTFSNPGKDTLRHHCVGWKWGSPNATSDYFNACASFNCSDGVSVGVPKNFVGDEAAPLTLFETSHYAYAGLIVDKFYREYIRAQLTKTLTAGNKYRISFQASLAEGSALATRLGACVTTNDPSLDPLNAGGGRLFTTYTADVESPGLVTNVTGWSTISATFVATGGEKFITIGNFANAWNQGADYATNANRDLSCYTAEDGAYYYIDDVHVESYCSGTIEDCNVNLSFVPNGGSNTKCCYRLKLDNKGNCPVYEIRFPRVVTYPHLPSPFVSASAPLGWTYSLDGGTLIWKSSGDGVQAGEAVIFGDICLERFPSTSSIGIVFFNQQGDTMCHNQVVELPVCSCTCNDTKMLTSFVKRTNSPPGKCCWDMTFQNKPGGCPALRVDIFPDSLCHDFPLATKVFTATMGPGSAPAQTVLSNFCMDEFTGTKTVYVRYISETGQALCVIPKVLTCNCTFHCDETELLTVPTGTNPCCNEVYVVSAPCDIYKIKVDAPNAGVNINQASPVHFPAYIGTYCNDTGTKTITARLKNAAGDTMCTARTEIKCPAEQSCCEGLMAYMTSGYDPSGNCACKFNIMATQVPNSPCSVFNIRIYNLGGGTLAPDVFFLNPVSIGDYKKIGEICVPWPTFSISPAYVTVKVYVQFLDAFGNVLCSDLLSQECSYIGRPANPDAQLGIDEQQVTTLNFNCRPNPFAGQTEFSYSLGKAADVTLELYDGRGRLVDVVENTSKAAGTYRVKYTNGHLPKGLYIARLKAGDETSAIKVLVEE